MRLILAILLVCISINTKAYIIDFNNPNIQTADLPSHYETAIDNFVLRSRIQCVGCLTGIPYSTDGSPYLSVVTGSGVLTLSTIDGSLFRIHSFEIGWVPDGTTPISKIMVAGYEFLLPQKAVFEVINIPDASKMFKSVTFIGSNDHNDRRKFSIDNIVVSSPDVSTVPEPSSIAMFLLPALGLLRKAV